MNENILHCGCRTNPQLEPEGDERMNRLRQHLDKRDQRTLMKAYKCPLFGLAEGDGEDEWRDGLVILIKESLFDPGHNICWSMGCASYMV